MVSHLITDNEMEHTLSQIDKWSKSKCVKLPIRKDFVDFSGWIRQGIRETRAIGSSTGDISLELPDLYCSTLCSSSHCCRKLCDTQAKLNVTTYIKSHEKAF